MTPTPTPTPTPILSPPTLEDWIQLRAMVSGRSPVPDDVGEGLVAAARQGGVLALLASMNPALEKRLAEELEKGVVVQMHIEQAEGHVADVLGAAGIHRVALLKGNATRRLLYDSPDHRPGADVDLLVCPRDFRPALRALKDAGWEDGVPLPTVRAGGSNPYAWAFRRTFGAVTLECDVHQRLTLGPSYRLDLDGMLDRAISHGDAPLPLAHPEDLFLGGVLHMGKTGFDAPLKSWVDLLRLQGHPDVDLGRVADRALEARMATVTWGCLRVLKRWFSLGVDPEVLRALRPHGLGVMALESMTGGQGPIARRWPRSRRLGYLFPGMFLIDGPVAAGVWSISRVGGLLRSRLGRQTTMPGA